VTRVDGGRQTLGGRYELQRLIATGGMGQVWRGRDRMLDRLVAVKVLRSEYADDPTFLARFRAEARHAAALSHPNIATVLDYGEATAEDTGENVAYLVMELVDGAPLSRLLTEEGPLDPDAALSVLSQAAAGLAEAHRAGVVHRDVKPGNILVRPDGRVKLTDFGIACSAESVPLTGTGQVIGTPQYMSPEQAVGEQVSPASDVYALGLVGYESLTGHAAFAGTNPVTVALKHVHEDPDPLPAEVPADVRHLIDAALAKDPQQRLPDGDAFLHAIEETVHRSPDTTPPTRPIAPAAVSAAVPPAAHRVQTGTPRPHDDDTGSRRRPLLLVLAVLAVVLLGGGAVALVSGPGGGEGTAVAPPASDSPSEAGRVLTAADYVGRPVEEVTAELAELGLTVGRQAEVAPEAPPGTVTALDPAGTEVRPGDRVEVTVAAPPSTAPAEDVPPAPAEDAPAPTPENTAPRRNPAPAEESAPAESAPAGESAPAEESAPPEESAPAETPAATPTPPSGEATTGAPEPSAEPSSEPTAPTDSSETPLPSEEPAPTDDSTDTATPSSSPERSSPPDEGGTDTGTPSRSPGSGSATEDGVPDSTVPEPTGAGPSGATPTT
jgi:eukaryotic-like serine/threonine-protein kinase